MTSILVVGASGILAPAASALVDSGARVTGVGRRLPMPAGVRSMHVDARDLSALDATLGTSRWSSAIVYQPAITARTLRRIEAAIDGRIVLVRTSAAADPVHGESALPAGVLQLGWQDDGNAVRWHSAAEVSDAALDVLTDGTARVLGVMRPWERRP